VCVCVCVCIHTYIHTYILTYMHAYIHTYIGTCTSIHPSIHTLVQTSGMSFTGLARKQEKKNSVFFPKPTVFWYRHCKKMGFPRVFVSQIQTVLIHTCVCLLCRDKGHTHIVKNFDSLLGKRTNVFYWKVFHSLIRSHFSLTAQGTRRITLCIPFLYCTTLLFPRVPLFFPKDAPSSST
jgi:hypothetical protein